MSIDVTISFIFRLLLVFIFALAVSHKIRNFDHFTTQLRAYGLLPDRLLSPFAFFLILIEGFLAFSLLFKEWQYPSFIAAAVLALYAAAMTVNLVQGREDLDCGCSGPSDFPQSIGWALVIRNCVLAFFALATAWPITSRSLSLVDIITVLLASIAVICIYAGSEQAIANQYRQRQYFALKSKDNRGSVA
jgi:hypothetical protein